MKEYIITEDLQREDPKLWAQILKSQEDSWAIKEYKKPEDKGFDVLIKDALEAYLTEHYDWWVKEQIEERIKDL